MTVIAAYIFVGALAGLLSGLLGIGGGSVVVPALSWIFVHYSIGQGVSMHMAAATSFAIMVVTTFFSLKAHHHRGCVLWAVYRRMVPFIVLGTVLGVIMADGLPSLWLRMIFGAFLVMIALRMFFFTEVRPGRGLPRPLYFSLISNFIGFKSGLLGIGGGALAIPLLTHWNVSMRDAVGVSAAISFTIALVGASVAMTTGANMVNPPAWSIGYVYWPAVLSVAIPSALFAPVGARLSHRLPVFALKRIFALLLFFVGGHMLWR